MNLSLSILNGGLRAMRHRICQFIRDIRIILKDLKRLAEDAVIVFAVIYGLYTVCRILLG